MENGRFVSYLRVSTVRQGASGLGLEAQRAAVADHLRGVSGQLIREVVEVESGKRNDRPALEEALKLCRKNRATLIIAKLDRLARNVHFISGLMESGVEFVAVDMPQANRFVVHILAAVAEQEADAISRRTKAALAAAKARGMRLGGRRVSAVRFQEIAAMGRSASIALRSQKSAQLRDDLRPVVDEIRGLGIVSLRAIASELNARGETTPRGHLWTSSQVLRAFGSRTTNARPVEVVTLP